MNIRVGTSGYYYMHWRGKFYPMDMPTKNYLNYYSTFFNTVEINSTFYHIPKENSIKNWVKSVNENFKFSVKVNRTITHFGEFKTQLFQEFQSRFKGVRQFIGFFLMQFPPSFRYNEKNMEDLLSTETEFKTAIEFRNKTWYESKILEKLNEKYNIAYSDYGNYSKIFLPHESTIYGRFHGAKGRYRGEYGDTLRNIFQAIPRDESKIKEIWLYFNNDYDAAAVLDAKFSKEYLRKYFGLDSA